MNADLKARINAAKKTAVDECGAHLAARIESGEFEAEQERLALALVNDPARLKRRGNSLNEYEREALERNIRNAA